MLEIVFSESEKGSMKRAKVYDEKKMQSGVPAYIGEKPSKAELKELFKGKAIGGNTQEVAYIGFSLDMGDISGEVDGAERQNMFRKLWGRHDIDSNDQEQFFTNQREDLEKLLLAATEGTPIRIWKSNAPYSICGFYYVCNLLRNIDCEVNVVSLPEYVLNSKNEIVTYSNWGEVKSGQLYTFLPLEKRLSQMEKQLLSSRWRELVEENATLRAVVNGKLISVSETFYDHMIIKNMPDEAFLMARLIGGIVGKYQWGVSDSWYALRIDKMIAEGQLVVVENKDESHPYGKILKQVTLSEC
ncbi:DUF3658 domain-containing protein [Fusibacter ferrireducens]|uniref:DUF1835 domain-containing protein n=1 Tax=Fusibacter ferrireducens TaxID=2785058 RepID=A0ABR9ZPI6_9FIRM|nr:DUF3658 domain-containing protein [Fusibacter ferrireducens]MBF4691534.1 DUF1835 domain-containing protein [Fusibacter ferrireducens]